MLRGIYMASTGLINKSTELDTIGNNLSNIDTAGYKRDIVVSSSFGKHLTCKVQSGSLKQTIGQMTNGVNADDIYTSYKQGTLKNTGRVLDFAIVGDGFFNLMKPDGTLLLTRNGQFQLDANGYLTDANQNIVVGQNGPIQLNDMNFSFNSEGSFFANGFETNKLLITCPQDTSIFIKQGDGTLLSDGGNESLPFTGSIQQGILEGSNVNVICEMSDMMESSRSFQSCSQIIKMMDEILQKTVNELGKL